MLRLLTDVPDRVLFKLAVTVHQCLNVRAPPYLSEHSSADTRRHLRSANRHLYLPSCRTAFLAQHLRPSGVLNCWPDDLELTPGFRDPTSSTDCVGVYLKRTCSRVTSASSPLGVLNDYALHKSTHLLTHSWNRGSGHRTRLTLRTRNVRRTDTERQGAISGTAL